MSTVSMGAYALGGQWGDVDEAQSTATVHAACDAGINLFDVADGYEPLVAEERLGKALKEWRHGVLISTKVGRFLNRQGHGSRYTYPTTHHQLGTCGALSSSDRLH